MRHLRHKNEQADAVDRPASRRPHEQGASLVEYALLIALIAVICVASVTLLGRNSSSTLNHGASGIGTDTTTTIPNPWPVGSAGYNCVAAGKTWQGVGLYPWSDGFCNGVGT
jgi:pilus assembly protein Flp/PilA